VGQQGSHQDDPLTAVTCDDEFSFHK
jgi:hypothetical protein